MKKQIDPFPGYRSISSTTFEKYLEQISEQGFWAGGRVDPLYIELDAGDFKTPNQEDNAFHEMIPKPRAPRFSYIRGGGLGFMQSLYPADVTKTYQNHDPYVDINITAVFITFGVMFGKDKEGQMFHPYLGYGAGFSWTGIPGFPPVSVMITGSGYEAQKGWYTVRQFGLPLGGWQGGINEQGTGHIWGNWFNESGPAYSITGGIYRFYVFR